MIDTMKNFSRNETLLNNLCRELVNNKSQEIQLYSKDGHITVNKIFIHILSGYKLEEKTDAVILPDLDQNKVTGFIDSVLTNYEFNNSISDHNYWLDSKIYDELEQVNKQNKSKNNIITNKKDRKQNMVLKPRLSDLQSEDNIDIITSSDSVIFEPRENRSTNVKNKELTMQVESLLDGDEIITRETYDKESEILDFESIEDKQQKKIVRKQRPEVKNLISSIPFIKTKSPSKCLQLKNMVNTKAVKSDQYHHNFRSSFKDNKTMEIIQKNLNMRFQVDNYDNITEKEDFESNISDSEDKEFTNVDIDSDDLVPLESVLLDEEEDLLFPDSVDFSDLKVIIAGHENLESNENYNNPFEDILRVSPTLTKKQRDEALKVVQICNICDKHFKDKGSLKKHIKSLHTLKNVQSTAQDVQCERQDVSACKSEPRTWICDLCGTELRSKRGMQTHLLIHQEGTKNIACDECSSKFRHKSTLVKHKNRIHRQSQANKLSCDICMKTFNHTEGLKRHKQKIHTTNPQFECKNCSKKFTFQYDLNRHTKLKSCTRKRYLEARKAQLERRDPLGFGSVMLKSNLDGNNILSDLDIGGGISSQSIVILQKEVRLDHNIL